MLSRDSFLSRRAWRRGRAFAGLAILVGLPVVLGLVVVIILIASGVAETFLDDADASMTRAALLLGVVVVPLIALPSALVAARIGLGLTARTVWSLRGPFRVRPYVVTFVLGLLAAGGTTVVATIATGGGLAWSPGSVDVLVVAALILLVPIQALSEELIFRGVLVQLLTTVLPRSAVSVVLAATMSSIVFSLVHGPAFPWVFLGQVLGGLIWVWLTNRTQGIEASAAAHGAWNLLLMVTLTLGMHSSTQTPAPILALLTLLTDILVAATAYAVLRLRSAKLLPV